MKILELSGVEKKYFKKDIFLNVNLEVLKGDKIAIIGENGTGKSTLIKIITEQTEITSGSIVRDEDSKFIYFDQFGDINPNFTVQEIMDLAFEKVIMLSKELTNLEDQMATTNDMDSLLEEYAIVMTNFEALGGYSYINEQDKFIDSFGFNDLRDVQFKILSGGERQYLRLALCIFNPGDVIILDEPLTFFDRKKVEWLSKFIKKSNKTFLVIAHNSKFIRSFATKIFDVDNLDVVEYDADYDKYVIKKLEYLKQLTIQNQEYDELIEKKYDSIHRSESWLEATVDAHRIAVMIRRLEREIKRTEDKKAIITDNNDYKFTLAKREIDTDLDDLELLVKIENLNHSYGKREIFKNLSFELYDMEHICILGQNSAGKTTFFKLLSGLLEVQSGTIETKNRCMFSFIPQEITYENEHLTLYEFCQQETKMGDIYVEEALERLFKNEFDINKKTIGTLSGGEKKRLQIMNGMTSNVDVLLIDEPTTFMDEYSKNKIIELIHNYDGAVILVTHEKDIRDQLNLKSYNLIDKKLDLINKELY